MTETLIIPTEGERRRERVFVTPNIAEQYLALNTRNRDWSDNQVAQLTKSIEEDRFYDTTDAVGFYASDGALANGQNRLKAIVRAGKGVWLDVVWGLPEESLLAQDRGRGRTVVDILKLGGIHMDGHPFTGSDTAALRFTIMLDRVWSGTALTLSDKHHQPTADQMYNAALEVPDTFLYSIEIGKRLQRSRTGPKLKASLGTALHFVCAQEWDAEATAFFLQLAEASNLITTTPVYKLLGMLIDDRAAKAHRPVTDLAAWIIKAFNFTMTGEPKQVLMWRQGANEKFPRFITRAQVAKRQR